MPESWRAVCADVMGHSGSGLKSFFFGLCSSFTSFTGAGREIGCFVNLGAYFTGLGSVDFTRSAGFFVTVLSLNTDYDWERCTTGFICSIILSTVSLSKLMECFESPRSVFEPARFFTGLEANC